MISPKEPPASHGDPAPASTTDALLDKVEDALDQDKEDKKAVDRLNNPFVKYVITSFVVLLFMIFLTYFLSFILKIPLPESKLLEGLMSTVLEFAKLLLS